MSAPLPPWLDPVRQQVAAALREGRLNHALLIAGEPGLGKRLLVDALAARLLCQAPREDTACGRCRACIWFGAGTHPDFVRIGPEPDSAVIKVAQVRALIARTQLTGQAGPIRVAVVDPADAMNAAAQNALLKTLEEPPDGVHLLLVADAPMRLLATVRSRTQAYAVIAPDAGQARAWLAAGAQDGGERQAIDRGLALAAGHPGAALAYAQPERSAAALAVAEDLRRLALGQAQATDVAGRWGGNPQNCIDDAIAWLRLWSWRDAGPGIAGAGPAPALPLLRLTAAAAAALRVRERLRAPLKPSWLLLEWLQDWQGAAR
jgi:DNA polymerase-3 subunit delta'